MVYYPFHTILYEVKVSRSDFLADRKKAARVKWHYPVHWHLKEQKDEIGERIRTGKYRVVKESIWQLNRIWIDEDYYNWERASKFRVEKPHLGGQRFYVVPWGLVKPEEVPEGWGLYWYRESDGRFFKKKSSEKFRPNVKLERDILTHAMRRMVNLGPKGIVVRPYSVQENELRTRNSAGASVSPLQSL